MRIVHQAKKEEIIKLDDTINDLPQPSYKKRLEYETEEEEPLSINLSWTLSLVLFIIADILEFIVSVLGLASGGIGSVLSFIAMIFEIPGAIFFLYLIDFYTKNGYLPQIESIAYKCLVLIEFFGFIPIIGSIVEIAPLKTFSMLASRGRLWRVKRLKTFRREIRKKEIEETEEI